MRAECCPVLLGLGGLVSLDSLLYDFRTMLNLAFSDASIGCGTASDVSPAVGSPASWAAGRLASLLPVRGGEEGRGCRKSSWQLGLRDSAFSPEGESRAVVPVVVRCRLPRDLTDYFQGCRAIWKSNFRQTNTVPFLGRRCCTATIQNPDSTGGRDSVLHWPGPQREDPFCAAGL